jgi:hypothetical protein
LHFFVFQLSFLLALHYPQLLRYAQEMSWREDNRRMPNGEQLRCVAHLAMSRKPSVDFSGYW